jgi:hypothetical protein
MIGVEETSDVKRWLCVRQGRRRESHHRQNQSFVSIRWDECTKLQCVRDPKIYREDCEECRFLARKAGNLQTKTVVIPFEEIIPNGTPLFKTDAPIKGLQFC